MKVKTFSGAASAKQDLASATQLLVASGLQLLNLINQEREEEAKKNQKKK